MPAEVTQNTETPDKAAVAAPGGQAASAKPTEGASPPEKSTAPEGGEKGPKQGEDAAPKTALEAAKRVMAKEGKQASEAKPQDGEQTPEKGAADADKAKAATDEDDASPPFKDDPRWKKMSSENRILQVAKEKNEGAIKALEPKAKAHDDLIGYFSEHNLNQQDVANGLTIMAAVRNDPAKAYELLKPLVEKLATMTGDRLPPDVQAKVEAGTIDEETGRELAKTRAASELERSRRAQLEERREREEQERARGNEEEQMSVVVSALNSAEAEWAKSDPDATKLKPLLNDAVLAMGGRNPPSNAEEARDLFDAALKKVRRDIGVFAPRPQAKDGILPVGGASKPVAQVPTTALEAAQAALAGMRG